jgi:DNA-binding LacI/PurR family transcriptional regulator
MLSVVEKDSAVNLPKQIRDLIVKRIQAGYYAPKKKLDSIRKLSDELKVSRVTVIEALKLLERENYIQRIPAKGTFVSGDVKHTLQTVRIILPFPETSMAPDALGDLENWSGVSAVYHGMVDEAKKQNTEITFQHFDEVQDEIDISRQLRRTESYDGAVFIGHQLDNLRKRLIAEHKFCVAVVQPVNMSYYPELSTVALKLDTAYSKLLTLAAKRGYKQIRIFTRENLTGINFEENNNKIMLLNKAASLLGLKVDDSPVELPKSDEDAFKKLSTLQFELKNKTELFFCCHTEMVPLLYRFGNNNNLKIGEDFGVTGHASGITFSNLHPELTYIKIDYQSIGREVCRMAIDGIRNGNRECKHKFLDANILITGKSI